MAFNGTGTAALTSTSVAPAVSATAIESSAFNTTMADIVAMLNTALCRDGQAVPTGNQPMSIYRHTGVNNATVRTHYAAAGQVQDGSLNYGASVVGTDAYAINPAVVITAYVAGQIFLVLADVANTGPCTLNVNSVGPVAIKTQDGADPATNVILATSLFAVIHDGINFVLLSPAGGAIVGSLTGNHTGTIVDASGNEVLISGSTASAVNEVTITNAAAGGLPSINQTGSGNVGLTVEGVQITNGVVTAIIDVTATAATITTANITTANTTTATITTANITTENTTTANITTANITTCNATNLVSIDLVGSYAFLRHEVDPQALVYNTTYSGADLSPAGFLLRNGVDTVTWDRSAASSRTGTWRCLGRSAASSGDYCASLFVRTI